MLVTGGEDSILNAWPIRPIPLDEEGLDSERHPDENMHDEVDVKMVSPKPRKRIKMEEVS